MKFNFSGYLLGVVLFIGSIILILLSSNAKFNSYMKDSWPNIAIVFLSVLLGSAIA